MNPEITNTHLAIVQELVSFLQERGWTVLGMEVSRYQDRVFLTEAEEDESWKGERDWKWALSIRTSPLDQDDLPVKVRKDA